MYLDVYGLWVIQGPYSQHFILIVTYEWSIDVFVPGSLFKTGLMFVILPKGGAPDRCFSWEGSDLIRKH